MTTRAFQKIYTKIENITKATVTLRAEGVGNDELATVGGKLAQVVKIMGDQVTLQVFAGTEGITTDSEVIFHGEPPKLRVSDNLAGRFFNAYGEPIEGGEQIEGEAREIGGPTVNPFRRIQPSELIATGIAGIDLNNTIVTGQKIPFFADPDQPYNAVMANVALRAKADKIILGGMGLSNDDFLYFEDWDLFNRMLASGCRAANVRETLVAMRVSPDFYARRGGRAYLSHARRFKRAQLACGYFSAADYFISFVPQAVVCLMPNALRGLVYTRILRKGGNAE